MGCLLGSLRTQLDKEQAVAAEYLVEVNASEKRQNERRDKNLPDILEPNEFMCPITQATMRDPVVAADGNSYEREAIEKLFERSNVSPLTNQPFKHKELVPNNALKQLIRSYEAQVHEKLVKLHEVDTLARTASRARHVEEKQALEEQLRLRQEAGPQL